MCKATGPFMSEQPVHLELFKLILRRLPLRNMKQWGLNLKKE